MLLSLEPAVITASYSATGFYCVFLRVLSRIFFNTAPRSLKISKNVDKSLFIAVGLKCSQSQTMLLFGVACYHNLL